MAKKLILIAITIAVIAGIFIARYLVAINTSAIKTTGVLYIPSNSDFQTVLDSLTKNDNLKDMALFQRAAKIERLSERVRSGRYLLTEETTYKSLARAIKRGMQSPVNLTFNNIRSLDRLAGVVSKYIDSDSVTILKALTNDSIIARYGFNANTFMGMFIPNTYQFYWTTTPEAFIERMNKEYLKFWNDERKAKLEELDMTCNEVITLASIVYEESKKNDEMPTIAGVYINRLNAGIPLQADPTVKFAIGDFSIRRVLNKHLEYESPYNTYIHGGLPPGPIAMPSIKAIDAVLNYSKHSYIYFCAKPDFSGYHNFARNLSEHNANAKKYSEFLNNAGIMR